MTAREQLIAVDDIEYAIIDGRPEIVRITLACPTGITGQKIRSLRIRELADEAASGDIPSLAHPDPNNMREHLDQVAEAYRIALSRTIRPIKALADASGLPRGTIARWVNSARHAGLLPSPGQGKTRP